MKLIISGTVEWETNKVNREDAINELFDILATELDGINIDITNDAWLVDENGNEVEE